VNDRVAASRFDDRWRGRFILQEAQDEVVLLRVDAMKDPPSC
jgi:hypothetical protein